MLSALVAGVVLGGTPGSPAPGARARDGSRVGPPLDAVLRDQAKLAPVGDPRGDRFERFASAVAIDGETAVVGAPGHDLPGRDDGAAYVFVRSGGTWRLEAKLSPSGPQTPEGFGGAVAISGDTVVVGGNDSFAPGAAHVFVRSGGAWSQEARLVPSDGQSFDRFGAAVSVSGDTVAVGAPESTTGFGFRSGAVYVFTRSAGLWTEQQRLLTADLAADDRLGASLAILGDTLVAASPFDDTGTGIDAGSAYVFTRSAGVWAQVRKLTASPGAAGARFGSSISLDVDVVAIGTPGELVGSVLAGAVHVFRRSGGIWSEEQRLAPSAPQSDQEFGAAVALTGDILVVGVPGEGSGQFFRAGTARLFERTGGVWIEAQVLAASMPEFRAHLGRSVTVSGDTTLAGAPGSDDDAGFAFVFRRGGPTWSEEARLEAPGTAGFDSFGAAVALEGDVLVVGAPGDDTPGGRDAGSVYAYLRTGASWTQAQKVTASTPRDGDRLGAAVALSGDTLAVGAPGASTAVFEAGVVHVFARSGGVWLPQQTLAAPDGAVFDEFGAAVSVDQDRLLVGAPGHRTAGGFQAGAAYVFVRSGGSWTPEQKLQSSSPAVLDSTGSAVALAGDIAVLGSPGPGPRLPAPGRPLVGAGPGHRGRRNGWGPLRPGARALSGHPARGGAVGGRGSLL